jgi:carboxyl-terminal processing protease
MIMTLTQPQRSKILNKIETVVSEKYYSPAFDQSAWQAIVQRNRSSIENASSTEAFEKAVQKMLVELSPKGLGLLSAHTPITPRSAINASFSVQTFRGESRWVFQDVFPGGVAAVGGARAGAGLLKG